MPSSAQPSASPRTASANCHMTCRVLRRAEVEAVRHGAAAGAGTSRRCGRPRRAPAARPRTGRARRSARCSRSPRRCRARSPRRPRTIPASAGCGEHGVAAHVAVVLIGHPRAAAQVRRRRHPQRISRAARTEPRAGAAGPARPRPARPGSPTGRPGVRRPGRRGRRCAAARRRRSPVPGDHQPVAVGDLPDHRGEHVPLRADGEEGVDVLRRHDRAHPLLRLAGEDLRRGHAGGAQRDAVQLDAHAAVACARELGGGARQPGAAEVLDADHQPGGEELQAALDEHLLGERVADLHRGQLLARPCLR